MAQHWTADELLFLENQWEKTPLKQLARQLGRSPKTLINRAYMMGMGGHPGTDATVAEHEPQLRDQARLTSQVIFLIDRGGDQVMMAADEFRPYLGGKIAYVVWPPQWRYRPKG